MKTDHKTLYTILAMLGLLAFSFGLDRLILLVKELVSHNPRGVVSMILLPPVAIIVVAMVALLLFWFTTSRMRKNYLIATVFIIFGVFILLLVLSNIQPLGSSFLFLQPFLLPSSTLFFAGSLVLVIGILNLFLPHPKE
jgi:hypothetical protein